MNAILEETFTRDSVRDDVIVVDGHGISITTDRKFRQLIITDGMNGYGRTRTITVGDTKVKRIVVIGRSGYITLEAMDLINGANYSTNGRRKSKPMSLIRVGWDGQLVNASVVSKYDAGRREAQYSLVNAPEGVEAITKYLMECKFTGHQRVFPDWDTGLWLGKLNACTDRDEIREVEGNEAEEYFGRLHGLKMRFTSPKVPEDRRTFDGRSSNVGDSLKNQYADDFPNALWNYGYGLAAVETMIACHIYGLDPDLGVQHIGRNQRHDMVHDVLESVRPLVDEYVINLIKTRIFRPTDFSITSNGTCRVARPLTTELVEQMPRWHAAVAPHVAHVAAVCNDAKQGWKPEAKRLDGTAKKTGRPAKAKKQQLKAV